MNAVRARVGNIRKETGRKLALDVEVPLLDVSPFRIAMPIDPVIRSQCWAAVKERETRYVGRKWSQSASQGREVSSRRRQNARISEGAGLSAAKSIWSPYRKHGTGCAKRATGPIQHCGRSDELIVRSVERSAREIHHIVVWVQPE